MAVEKSPFSIHHTLVNDLFVYIRHYFDSNHIACKAYNHRFSVFLDEDSKNCVNPDTFVVSDKSKWSKDGYHGVPDWIIEIISPGTEQVDCGTKFFKYRSAGVKEYWIINPLNYTVSVYDFERGERSGQYTFDSDVHSCIYRDFSLKIADVILEPWETDFEETI